MTIGKLATTTVNTVTTAIYTAPANKIACVDLNLYQSTTVASLDVTIYVGSGTANEDLYKIVNMGSTNANRWHVTTGILLNAGEKITVKLSVAGTIICTVRGIEEDLT